MTAHGSQPLQRVKKLEAFRKVFFLPEDNRKMMNELNKIYDNLETVGFLKKIKEKDRFEKRNTGLWMRFERAIPHDYSKKRKRKGKEDLRGLRNK